MRKANKGYVLRLYGGQLVVVGGELKPTGEVRERHPPNIKKDEVFILHLHLPLLKVAPSDMKSPAALTWFMCDLREMCRGVQEDTASAHRNRVLRRSGQGDMWHFDKLDMISLC